MKSTATKTSRVLAAALLLPLAAGIAACDTQETGDTPKPLPRSVSFLTLKPSDPSRHSLVAGSVESWKKEMVGFRVGGRVLTVVEPSAIIKGRLTDREGNVIEPGSLMGSLENERYRLRVKEAQARVDAIAAEAAAVRVDIDRTIPSELREVQAEYDRAKVEFNRQTRLLKRGAGTQKRVDNARAAFRGAEARLGQIRAKRAEKRAQLTAIEAQVAEAEEVLRQANVDVADTELYSPFNGQISKVHVIPGGIVEKGQPVVTVQMMDPMKVQVAVSPETDRDINFNDVMNVYVDGAKTPLNGWVWNKDTVADASTRTFMVTLLVRNRQVERAPRNSEAEPNIHRTDGLWNVESELDNGRAPFFANAATLHRDDQGYFLWKAEGLSIDDLSSDFSPVFKVRKVRVEVGERQLRLLQVFTYRQLASLAGIDPRKDLFTGKLPDTVKDGDKVFLSRKRWLMRPGQLVRVDLHHGRLPVGFYVPAKAVISSGDEHHVYVAKEQADGLAKAVRIPVRTGASLGTYQAIEPATDGALTKGMKLIVDGAHYLRDGDSINAYNEVEASL